MRSILLISLLFAKIANFLRPVQGRPRGHRARAELHVLGARARGGYASHPAAGRPDDLQGLGAGHHALRHRQDEGVGADAGVL